MKKRNLSIKFYDSFEQEEEAEIKRRSKKTPKECLDEFAILQRRVLVDNWHRQKMVRTITFEKVTL
jgi:acetyl-CoA acetyltransferase